MSIQHGLRGGDEEAQTWPVRSVFSVTGAARIGMLMRLKGRYLPPASCRVSSCLAARCDECDFTKVAPSQVVDSQFACSLKLELQFALLRMCQSPPFTHAYNSARKFCDGGTHGRG